MMKKHLHNSLRALFLSLAVLLSLPMLAVEVEIDGINYDLNADATQATVVSKSDKYSGDVVIPESVEHDGTAYSVTSIGNYAFEGCSGLSSVTIPNSVTSMGDCAFFNCSGLTSVTIGNGVASIGTSTFEYCSRLTSVTIGNSVKSIGNGAFSNCSGLTSVTIPNSVMSIGASAFYNCTGLTSVTIPNSVTSIGGEAFRDCSELSDVYCYAKNVPSTVSNAFYGSCPENHTLHVPAGSVESYKETAPWSDFKNIVALPPFSGEIEIDGINYELNGETKQATVIAKSNGKYSGEVIIPESVEHEGTIYSVTSIGDYAFESSHDLTSATIPNSVKSIGAGGFTGCYNMESVTIGNSVESMGNYAFSGCSGLTSVVIPNSVKNIGQFAFVGCSGLKSVTISNSVESIEHRVFSTCTSLTSVVIPNSVKSIAREAFENCYGLKSVTIGDGVETIESHAFVRCTGLTSLIIPNSVESIGTSAFYGCDALSSVSIGNGVTVIGEMAFCNCLSLTSVTIGNGVKTIESEAFAYSNNILEVYCHAEEVPSTGRDVFGEWHNNATLHVPAGSVDSYKATAPWSSFGKHAGMVDVSSAGFATLFLDYNAEIPEVVEAYIAKEVQGESLKMKKVEGVLPAMTGVIIKANEGTYAFIQSEDTPAEIGENLLVGSAIETEITAEDNTSYYILAAPDDNVGMYPVELVDGAFVCKANKAYLPISSAPARIYFDFGTETGILETENGNVKAENCYDLSGRRVQKAQKGIYIVNGRKVVK